MICPKCNNSGVVDSGGVTPSGQSIEVECYDCWFKESAVSAAKEWMGECDPWMIKEGRAYSIIRDLLIVISHNK